jgi:hypothetical protein
MKVGKRGVAVAVLLLGLALPGCGGGGSPDETTAALTKAAFVRQADAICQGTREEIVKEFSKIQKLADDPQAREELEYKLISSLLIPSLEHEVEQLRALGAPPGGAQIERMLKLIEGAIAEAKTEPETYVAGDSYRNGSVHFGKAQRLARDYGIEGCPVQ